MSSSRALRLGSLALSALCLALLVTTSAAPAAGLDAPQSAAEASAPLPELSWGRHRSYVDAGGEFRPDDLLTRGELAGFIAASGAAEVECVQPVMDRLIGKIPFRLRQRQQVLTYEFGREDAPGGIPAGVLAGDRFIYSDHLDCDPAEFVENTRLREMYEVICQSFDGYREGTPFTGWYVDAFARIKKAEGYLCGICWDGKVVSVAGVYNVSPYTAMVSSVATLPDYRGRGLARRCVRRCLEYIRYLDVRPTLTAATDSLVDYYKGLGFREYAVRCSAIYQRKN